MAYTAADYAAARTRLNTFAESSPAKTFASLDKLIKSDGGHITTKPALQAAIDDALEGGVVNWRGAITLDGPLVISKDITLDGGSYAEISGTAVSSRGNGPWTSPHYRGSHLIQAAAGQDMLQLTGTGKNVHLRNFGMRWADDIMFRNTGHGIVSVPTAMSGLGHESGTMHSDWHNLSVFGHDGEHYAYKVINSNFIDMRQLHSHGGGGFWIECDSYSSIYGNSVHSGLFVDLFCGGSAHGYLLRGRTPVEPSIMGPLNLLTFIRPQVNMLSVPAQFSTLGIPEVTVAQYMWKEEGTVNRVGLYDPNMEQHAPDGNPIYFSPGPYGTLVSNGGLLPLGTIYESERRTKTIPTFTMHEGLGSGPNALAFHLRGSGHAGAFAIKAGDSPAPRLTDIVTMHWAGFLAGQPMISTWATEYGLIPKFYVNRATDDSFTIRADVQLTVGQQYQIAYLVQPFGY